MKPSARILIVLAALTPLAANALSLELPTGAVQTAAQSQPFGSAAIPVGVFANGAVPKLTAEGAITAQTWKIATQTPSTLAIMAPLRQQLLDGGYEIILDCDTEICGGFDFRFEINLLPEPGMHVDLGDFRYVSARLDVPDGPDAVPEFISLIVSRSGSAGFVQMTRVGPRQTTPSVITASTKSTAPELVPTSLPAGSLETLLATVGRAPLEDLSFITGSSNLGDDKFASLGELAKYLNANPDKTVALVGHTDAEGSLVNNMALSKRRAASVVQRLVSVYGVANIQLEAAGVGYLVPRASNLTADGRDLNRRVEVILTSTQ